MTVRDIAASEQTTTRTIQRYITVGFGGHKLPAVKLGNAYSVTEEDYRQWRIDCGFDAMVAAEVVRRETPVEIPQVEVIAPEPEPIAPEPGQCCAASHGVAQHTHRILSRPIRTVSLPMDHTHTLATGHTLALSLITTAR